MTARRPRFGTVVEMLEARAARAPEQVAYRFLDRPVGYGRLWRDAGAFGSLLRELGVGAQEPVLLMLPNGHAFFTAFYGVLRAGATAVPLFPGSGVERVAELARLCGAGVVVVPDEVPPALVRAAGERGLHPVTVAEAAGRDPPATPPRPGPDDRAFVQFTSGSTGRPKGVSLTHRNLLVNLEQLIGGMRIVPEDVFVSWLPCYHDLGLILMSMAPFYVGAGLVLLPTSLRDVSGWLGAVQRYRGTLTAAPDFAYRLCLRYVARPEAYDLSSLRVALNAAEPVRADTIRRFEAAFGLDRVMIAGYGLAEATVGVSASAPGSEVIVDDRGFVSVGTPFEGVEVLILGGGGPLPAGEVGEIAVRSPANTGGYLADPEATRALFWRGGYLRTGDLGYLDDRGRLFVVGRSKNIILRQGENVAPQELEACADAVEGVRFSAAIGIDRGDVAGEQPYLFAELRPEVPEAAYGATARAIVNAVFGRLGFRPGRVFLVEAGSLPLTPNGKLQHARLKADFLAGRLRGGGAILFPEF